MGADDELDPLLGGLRRGDLSVGDIGWDEVQQTVLEDLWTIIYIVLLRGQICQVLLL